MTPRTAKEWARYYWENNSLVEGAEPNWIRLTECFDQAMAQACEPLEKELAELKRILVDPEAVWVNILRGTIAKPMAVTHLEGEWDRAVEEVAKECESVKSGWEKAGQYQKSNAADYLLYRIRSLKK